MNTDCLNASMAVCAICLEPVNAEERCYSFSCMHQFCYACLTEWTKIKSECPLCKENIQVILFNIRPNGRFEEFTSLAPLPAATSNFQSADVEFNDNDHDDGNDYEPAQEDNSDNDDTFGTIDYMTTPSSSSDSSLATSSSSFPSSSSDNDWDREI